MGKKSKTLVTEIFPVWAADKNALGMLAQARGLLYTREDDPNGRAVLTVVGKPGKVCKFEKDLQASNLIRKPGMLEQLAEGLRSSGKMLSRHLGNGEDLELCCITADEDGFVVTIRTKRKGCDGTTISDDSGIFEEIQSSEEDRVCLDQEGADSSENGYLSDEDTIRPEVAGEGAGEAVVDIPVEDIVLEQEADGEWITETEYAKRYNVPQTTVSLWVRRGELKADKKVRPRLVFDGKKVPIRDRNGKKPRWLWVDRDILEDANSQVDEAF